ncbi:hypothetical protein [Actinomadura rubrisoli]|uniref:HK97 gp10 family phage protein n=1 Tax=Actinomadura rubrisoli TaxID=2530368 RepID=A0A4R5BQV8_9ACTN|nr:hypothetical protein [Actinomadura rubrisoli]TDD88355.1 hypothetical protein E1298_15205 [Actinomadura rubrisoli]
MTRFRLDWDGERVAAQVRRGAGLGSKAAAELLLEEANRRVPLEKGRLRESGQVTTDAAGKAAVSYSDPNAVRQHEDPYYKHDPGRSRKYLEIPMLTQRPAMLRVMSRTVRNFLRR